mgnify:CR=1 FL=1
MYFDRPTQARLVQRFERMLAPHGLLVLGHAENVVGLRHRHAPRERHHLPAHAGATG